MAYGIVFLVLAGYLAGVAALFGGFAWLLAWPAASFAIVALAYLGAGPRVFGKQVDGGFALWGLPLLGPYFLLTWVVWRLQRLISREPTANEVISGLWLGRRAAVGELPPGTTLVVDLTAEFLVPWGLRAGREYRCLPTLDALPSREADFRSLLAEVAAWPGIVFVHCALGHGRSAAFVAAVLIARGFAPDVRSAERLLREARPGVRLRPGQRRLVERATRTSAPSNPPP